MSKPINPYVAGPPIRPADFCGRRRIVEKIFDGLGATYPLSFSVVGDRRVGKTSLLRYIADPGVRKERLIQDYIFALLDVRELGSPLSEAKILNSLAQKIDPSQKVQTRDEFRDLVKGRDEKIVLLFDEFDTLFNEKPTSLDVGGFTYFLRSLAGSKEPVIYIVASLKALYELDQSGESSPFCNIFTQVRLGLFDDNEAQQLIERSSSLNDYADFILEMAGRHPYFLQLACRITCDKIAQGQILSDAYVEKVIKDEFSRQARGAFDSILRRSESWREALIALTDGHSITQHKVAIRELAEYGYVLRERETYQLFSTIFKDYVIREYGTQEVEPEPTVKLLPRLIGLFGHGARALVWDFPVWLGRLAKRIGGMLDEWGNWLIGVLIIVLFVLAIFGQDRILNFLSALVGGE